MHIIFFANYCHIATVIYIPATGEERVPCLVLGFEPGLLDSTHTAELLGRYSTELSVAHFFFSALLQTPQLGLCS